MSLPSEAVPGADPPRTGRPEGPAVVGQTGDRPLPSPMPRAQEPDIATDLDRFFRSRIGRLTFGLSPPGLLLVHLDWLAHLAFSPGKQQELMRKLLRKALRFGLYAARASLQPDTRPPSSRCPRTSASTARPGSGGPSTSATSRSCSLQQWLHNATTGVRGVSRHDEQVVTFVARQILDIFAPTNFPWTNPEVLKATFEQGGANFLRGVLNFLEDWERAVLGRKPAGTEAFAVGNAVAVTPGKVVYRNRLIELIQYAPTTQDGAGRADPDRARLDHEVLHPRPVAAQLAGQVPGRSRAHRLHDLLEEPRPGGPRPRPGRLPRRSGVMEALDAVAAIVPGRQVHAVGYCLGGTLLAIAAAAMARDGDDRLRSVTLFATETDFTEPGELALFIDETEVTFLEDLMWDQGFLDGRQMARRLPAAALERPDLVARWCTSTCWASAQPMTDLMAWNADGTRLPYRMHSEYLRDHASSTTTWRRGATGSAAGRSRWRTSACRSSWSARSRTTSPPGARSTRSTC